MLAEIKSEERSAGSGLRIYLGAAPGVGKTFAMLQEAHRRQERGTDVVVGFVETHGRLHTAEQIGDLEIVPPRRLEYRGVTLHELDTEAVLARHPTVALVDELAHTNAPGSKHGKRYEDVQDLLAASITVISTLNIQHIESLNTYIEHLTGIAVHETVPDWVLDRAEQVELIDMAPEALIRRMAHGNIYPPAQARSALANFFTIGNLSVLRDLALRATAKEVEEKLDAYMRDRHLEAPGGVGERIMAAVDHHPIGKVVIRRAWRTAAALKGELVVVHVESDSGRRQPQTVEEERELRANLQLADEMGATVVRLRGKVAAELIAYARANHISQMVIGQPAHGWWETVLRRSVTDEILRAMAGIDVHVIGEQPDDPQPRR